MNWRNRGGVAVAWAVCAAASAAIAGPELYDGGGGWVVVAGAPESISPPKKGAWSFEEGVWIGRLPEGISTLKWGDSVWPVADAPPLPQAPVVLPLRRNSFGACAVRSLSVRYDSVVRTRRWSLMFSEKGAELDFEPLALPGGRSAKFSVELEDVVSGQRWPLRPTRRGREGGLISSSGDARFYAGMVDDGDIDWSLVTFPQADGRRIVQGRLMVVKSDFRLLRLRVSVQAGAPGEPALQAESPPAVVAVSNGAALALFPDLAEPRRFRALAGAPDAAGLEFDLAPTKATGNFPRKATFSVAVDAWETAGAETAPPEALARLARAGGAVALPEEIVRAGLGAVPEFEPGAMRLRHPGGFQDGADVRQYLLVKTSGLFRDREWAASALQCAVQDAQGEPQVALAGDEAILAVNPDPDLETMLELGQNRGLTLLDRIRQSRARAVWIRAGALPGRVDHGARALHLCDYPAVWEAGSPSPGVDLGQAEAELIASLACVLQPEGICLLVEDGGPLAPFTTYHADALVCASAAPDEMRRQRALAGPRPVLWTAGDPGPEAAALARDLGFVRPGKTSED